MRAADRKKYIRCKHNLTHTCILQITCYDHTNCPIMFVRNQMKAPNDRKKMLYENNNNNPKYNINNMSSVERSTLCNLRMLFYYNIKYWLTLHKHTAHRMIWYKAYFPVHVNVRSVRSIWFSCFVSLFHSHSLHLLFKTTFIILKKNIY